MTSLQVSLDVVLPMFLLMGLGLALRRLRLLGDGTLDDLNNLCFRLFLPIVLFKNIYSTDLSRLNQPFFLLFAAGLQVVILGLLLLTVPRLVKANPARASTAQAIFRTNFIMFGLVISERLLSGEDLGVVSILAAVMIPLYNIGGVLILEKYRGGRVSPGKVAGGIAKNPFVLACLLGLSILLLGVRLPGVAEKVVNDLAAAASPISLIALGAWFRPGSLRRYRRELAVGVLGRLVVVPALFLPICILAGFRGAELLGLTCMLITPTAVATFNMAVQMDADGELACLLVVAQSACSLPTMFFWLFLLGRLGLLPVG